MPVFRYRAVSHGGEMLQGEIEAPSQAAAIEKLQGAGHLPISAEAGGAAAIRGQRPVFRWPRWGAARHDAIRAMTRELATLLKAGLPLDQALSTLADVSASPAVKKLVRDIYARVQGGAALSGAMEAQGESFSRLYLNLIRAGEAGGALETVLQRLADYLERSAALRANIVSALIYPVILLFIALFSVSALLVFVVPQFVPLFEDTGAALPLATRLVFGAAEGLQRFWWTLPLALAVGGWLLQNRLKAPAGRLRWHSFLLRLPLCRGLIARLEVARFARTLGTLLGNGVPLLTGVALVREVITNQAIAAIMSRAIERLEQGGRLAEALVREPHFPALAVQLIRVGEESGQLEAMLLKIADIYDIEVNTTIKRLLALVEPVLILGLGGLIAVIIISILVAILGLNELVV